MTATSKKKRSWLEYAATLLVMMAVIGFIGLFCGLAWSLFYMGFRVATGVLL